MWIPPLYFIWEPHGTRFSSPASEHQPAGFLRGGVLLAFEIKLCQSREMKGMLGGVRWDTGSAWW